MPPGLRSDAERVRFDSGWRLHALTQSFCERLKRIDTNEYDIEDLLEIYVRARQTIGVPTQLRVEGQPGTKRKRDHKGEAVEAAAVAASGKGVGDGASPDGIAAAGNGDANGSDKKRARPTDVE